jgi:hypothetical protein
VRKSTWRSPLVRARSFDLGARVARIVESRGTIAALGEG